MVIVEWSCDCFSGLKKFCLLSILAAGSQWRTTVIARREERTTKQSQGNHQNTESECKNQIPFPQTYREWIWFFYQSFDLKQKEGWVRGLFAWRKTLKRFFNSTKRGILYKKNMQKGSKGKRYPMFAWRQEIIYFTKHLLISPQLPTHIPLTKHPIPSAVHKEIHCPEWPFLNFDRGQNWY